MGAIARRQRIIGGGGGAPVNVPYIVLSTSPSLTDERQVAAGPGVIFTDFGANGNFRISVDASGVDHGGLAGLGDDDHTQYAILAGRGTGQILKGGTGAAETLDLYGTAHATPGSVRVFCDGGEQGLWLFTAGAESTTCMQFRANSASANERYWALANYGADPGDFCIKYGNAKGGDPYDAGSFLFRMSPLSEGRVSIGNADPAAASNSKLNVQALADSGGFRDFVSLGQWRALGFPTGTDRLAFGGYRATEWTAVEIHASGAEVAQFDANGITLASGTVRLPNGAFNAPALTFSNDLDTGIYLNAAGDLRINVDGAASPVMGFISSAVFTGSSTMLAVPGPTSSISLRVGPNSSVSDPYEIAVFGRNQNTNSAITLWNTNTGALASTDIWFRHGTAPGTVSYLIVESPAATIPSRMRLISPTISLEASSAIHIPTGNVGIGKAPAANVLLDILRSVNAQTGVNFANLDSNTGVATYLQIQSNTGSNAVNASLQAFGGNYASPLTGLAAGDVAVVKSGAHTGGTLALYASGFPVRVVCGTGPIEVARFNSTEIVFNEDSNDVDFRVESNGNANAFFVDGGNDRVACFTNAPNFDFDVAGGKRVGLGAPNSAPTDADLDNGQMSAWLDEAGHLLTFRVRYSDGTLKTGTVALV